MKLLTALGVGLASVLMAFPMLFANGDAPTLEATSCLSSAATDPPIAEIEAILATIRQWESGGEYDALSEGSTASGAYQFIDGTWANYGGYARASMAPPDVQDAKATEHVRGILDANDGDVTAVPVVWYIGYVPPVGDPAWDTVPGRSNRLTPRQYQAAWLAEYARLSPQGQSIAPPTSGELQSSGGRGGCGTELPGEGQLASGGWAYPAALDLFSTAPVDRPHHDYPAWDWPVPAGTPIFAVRGGEVVSVSTWDDNTLDHPCPAGQTCSPCGLGLTIADDTGTQWTYCHGSQVSVSAGQRVSVGTQVLSSGNTGRSTGPHLHLGIRTSDGQSRCPQPLLAALRDYGVGMTPTDLPTSGCSY